MNNDLWEEYEELFSSDDFEARERFVRREDLTDVVIQDILENEGDLGILSSLAENPILKSEYLIGLFNYEYAISQEEDDDLSILRGLASNPSSAGEILDALAEHDDEEIAEIAIETRENLN